MAQKTLLFISRHEPTNGQVAVAQKMGFDNIKKQELIFGDNPISQVKEVTDEKTVAVVAPLNIGLKLLRADYDLIEFVNTPSARTRGVFLCQGAWLHKLDASYFIPCPIPLKEQEESSLTPKA